jgi:hypothetical protein
MFIWIAMTITGTTDGGGIKGALNIGQATWSAAAGGKVAYMVGLTMNYVIVIGFFVASIILAKKLAGQGSGTINKATSWVQGKMSGVAKAGARGTVGRAARVIDEKSAGTAIGNSRTGRFLRSYTTGAVANSKFGTKMSAVDAKKKTDKRDTEIQAGIEKRTFGPEDKAMKSWKENQTEARYASKEALENNSSYQKAKTNYEDTVANPMALPAKKEADLRQMREAKRDALKGSKKFQKYSTKSDKAHGQLAGAEVKAQEIAKKLSGGFRSFLPGGKVRRAAGKNIQDQLRQDRETRYNNRQAKTKEGKDLKRRLKELKDALGE